MHPEHEVVRIEVPLNDPAAMKEFQAAMDEWQDAVLDEHKKIELEYGVSAPTANAIYYLRSRSRWTEEKEQELIDRDHWGNPIPLNMVLTGEF